MVGRNRNEIVAKCSELFTHPEDRSISDKAHHRLTSGEVDQVSYTKRYLRKNGQVIVAEVSKSAVRDASGSTLCFVTSVRDVTKEHALSTQLSHQALHDSLTGLPNRVLFENRLSQAHARTARRGGWNAVMLLDLDDFKEVNDSLGHLVGDELLVALARRFEEVTRSTDNAVSLRGRRVHLPGRGTGVPGSGRGGCRASLRRARGAFHTRWDPGATAREHRGRGI